MVVSGKRELGEGSQDLETKQACPELSVDIHF